MQYTKENPHVTTDYPYGFTLRCTRKMWIETATKGVKRNQQRIVTQTLNPKTGRWNKPKNGFYYLFVVMVEDSETGYMDYRAISEYDSTEKCIQWREDHGHLLDEDTKARLDRFIKYRQEIDEKFASGELKWTINSK